MSTFVKGEMLSSIRTAALLPLRWAQRVGTESFAVPVLIVIHCRSIAKLGLDDQLSQCDTFPLP